MIFNNILIFWLELVEKLCIIEHNFIETDWREKPIFVFGADYKKNV
jgi:hypothetical protein